MQNISDFERHKSRDNKSEEFENGLKKSSQIKKNQFTSIDSFVKKSNKNREKSKKNEANHQRKREEIQISSSSQQGQSKPEQKDKIYTYSIAGKSAINIISEKQLRQKADTLLLSAPKQESIPQNELLPSQVVDLNVNGKPRKQRYRYFWNYLQRQVDRKKLICYRCGKQGHISKSCMQKEKNTCKCCLKNHKEKNICILYSYCQECGQEDHISYECQTKVILNCTKCKRKGHLAEQCGAVFFQKIQGGNIAPKVYNLRKVDKSDLQKLKCLNNCQKNHGHFSCYRFEFTKDLPYSSYLKREVQQQSEKTFQSKQIEEGEFFDY